MALLLPKFASPPLFPLQKPFQTRNFLLFPSAAGKLDVEAPLVRDALREKPPQAVCERPSVLYQKAPGDKKNKDDFYLNLGVAVRTLREDLRSLFVKDLNYDIYREDISFIDPLNTFQGIENYKLIFWALRFHGRILFREIGLEIFRVWQPSENMILIRWELQGVPRVPWEAGGRFQGTSWYKLDRNGKIYEHKVDNLNLKFPRATVGPRTMMDLVAAAYPPSPNLTFLGGMQEKDEGFFGTCSWLKLYRAVKGTLGQEGLGMVGIGIEGLVTCS